MDINFLTFNVLSSHYTYFNLAKCPPNLTCQTELETIEIRDKRYSKIIHFILSTNPALTPSLRGFTGGLSTVSIATPSFTS